MPDFLSLETLRDFGWGLEVFVAVFLTLIAHYFAMRILKLIESRTIKTSNIWDDTILEAAKSPLGWFILIMGLLWAVEISDAYVNSELFSASNLELARELTLVCMIVMFGVRFTTLTEQRMQQRIDSQGQSEPDQSRIDPTTLAALAKLLRLAIIISGVLIALPTLGIEITALLAFGGVGGIAIGFAAQDLLANFFGGLMIYMDRPFAIGDWIRSPDREIEGTVESIGWRLTVVRTFDKRPLYIPNSVFNTLALENPSRMSNRRIKETIGIRYRDASKMSAIVADVKDMLLKHEEIDSGQTLMVNFNSYAASSLDFFIYTFTKTTNWIRFHEIKQDVMLKIIEIVHSHDADFAFPTTTLDGIDVLRPEPDANS